MLAPDSSPSGLCPACLFARLLSSPEDVEQVEEGGSFDLVSGSTFGPFEIEAVLGEGGMSTVYQARETTLERVVALKVLPPEFLHDHAFAARFQQEARVVARLEHPRIVPVYASGIERGIPWMSMRMMAGGSLETLVRAGHPGPDRLVGILRDVAAALDYAHARGVVHRDVKPSNILIDRTGDACIGDFGLARVMEGSGVRTRTGVIAGTPQYMAPEQGLGRPLDHRVDIYSLGVVAYEMLVGRPPFDADSPVAVLMKHATDPLPVPSKTQVSHATLTVLRKALAKDPRDRWPTATAFVSALEKSLAAPRRAAFAFAAWAAGLALVVAAGVLALLPSAMTFDSDRMPIVEAVPAQVAPGVEVMAPPSSAISSPAPDIGSAQPTGAATDSAAARPPSATPTPGRAAAARAEQSRTVPPVPADPPASGTPDPTTEKPVPGRVDAPPPTRSTPVPERTEPAGAGPRTGPVTPTVLPPAEDTIRPPIRVRTVRPTYHPLARAAQIEGDVVVEAVVGIDGRVTEVEVLRSVHPLLDAAAREAVLQYRYRPALRNGVPEASRVQLTVSFRLQ